FPKPPFYPKPKPLRLHRRKRVTIIAGFQCTDGTMLCADSEQTSTTYTKSQIRKTRLFHVMGTNLAIGGAGDGSLVDYAVQDLVKHLSRNAFELNSLEGILSDYAKRFFQEHIKIY